MTENENDIFFTITKYLIEGNFTIKEFSNMVFKYILYEMPLIENVSLEELNNTIKSYFTENKIDEQYIITMVKSMIKKYRSDISIEDLLNSNYRVGYNFDLINGIEGKVVSKIATKIYNMIASKQTKETPNETLLNEKFNFLLKKIESQNIVINKLVSDINNKNKEFSIQNLKINNLNNEIENLKIKQVELEKKIIINRTKTLNNITFIPTAEMTTSPTISEDEIDVDVDDDVEMEKDQEQEQEKEQEKEQEINPPDFNKFFSQFEKLGKSMAINFIKSIKIDQ
jgi:hypothetical protein